MSLVQEEESVCPVCGQAEEVNQYLFVHCARIYKLWAKVANLWDLIGDVVTCFNIWCHAIPKDPREPIWRMAFVALVWVIWKIRNRVIFRRETFDEESYFKMWHFELAWLVKIEWGKLVSLVADIIRSPGNIGAPKRLKKRKHH